MPQNELDKIYELEASDGADEPEVSMHSLSIADIRCYAQGDLNFFASVLMPTVVTSPFPVFYCHIWHMLIQAKTNQDASKVFRFALGLPRNHAKTTFVKLLICYFILYEIWSFPLIVAATASLAENILADIHAMLSSDEVTQIWGDWNAGLTRNTNGLKRGEFLGRSVVLAALGAGSSIRGLNIANRRPDVILMDDMQTRENALSTIESAALIRWMFSTLLKARDQSSSILIYIGNMYNDKCILNQLRNHDKWTSLITGAILENGLALWGELFTVEQLMDEYKHDELVGLGDIWYAEVMNLIIGGSSSLLSTASLPTYPYEDETPIATFITVDPAGFKDGADDNVVARHEVHEDSVIVTSSISNGIWNPGQVVDLMIDEVLEHNVRTIGIESVGYQATLKWLLEKELAAAGLLDFVHVVELSPSRRNKTARILAHVSELKAQTCFIHSSCKDKYLQQALAFRVDRRDNRDDILDGVAYCLDIRNGNLIIPYVTELTSDKLSKIHVIENNTFLD